MPDLCFFFFVPRHRPPAPHGPHIRLDQPRFVPLLGNDISRLRRLAQLTRAIKFHLRTTPRPCFSSATHTRPSSSPLFSISCSRICLRTPKRRRPSFSNAVCRGRPTRNLDGVGCPDRGGSSLSDLSGGNHGYGEVFHYRFFFWCLFQTPCSSGWPVLFAAHEVGCTSVLCCPTYVRQVKPMPGILL